LTMLHRKADCEAHYSWGRLLLAGSYSGTQLMSHTEHTLFKAFTPGFV
jgi:hypothetical protein